MSAPVSTSGLRVELGGAPILRGIDLTVREGEVLALLGANGSGKTTLMRAVLGVVPISSGDARVYGVSVRSDRTAVPWHRVGYVPQRVAGLSGIPATALEVVLTGMLDRRRLWVPRHARARAMEALESVSLADRAGSAVHELSGGQQQRVSIARALVRRPDLLLLDEPVAGVDRPTRRTFADLLHRLHHEGTTVVIVLHELGEMRPLIDRAVVLRHGKVVHDGDIPVPAPGHRGPGHEHVHLDHGDHPAVETQWSLP